MSRDNYTISFTTGAALMADTVAVAKLYVNLRDWNKVRTFVIEENTIQARTVSTLKKLYREISSRLKKLSDEELTFLVKGEERDREHIVWFAICQRYPLIKAFAIEVLNEQFEKAQYLLSFDDYDSFYNRNAEWHSNLDKASLSTRSKSRQVVFKMIRECGLVNESGEILPQSLNDKLQKLIRNRGDVDINIFPGALNH